ncbi:hypothetical protein LQ954_09020 [Sphingomonas sp. IC-11]|nr:hypothetical protein [Sphingomonas sp. IC-11]
MANILLTRSAITSDRAIPYSPDHAAAQHPFAELRGTGIVKLTEERRCWFDLRTHDTAGAEPEPLGAVISVPWAILAAALATPLYSG